MHDSFMCAGGDGKATCAGDGGSPLVCPSNADPKIYVQAGIVSFGASSCDGSIPEVFASVPQMVCWIDLVTTCHHGANSGDYQSFFGLYKHVCETWIKKKVKDLKVKALKEGGGTSHINVLNEYNNCFVNWN